MTRQEAYQLALQAGFALSTQCGQESDKRMPVTDGDTLMRLIKLVEAKVRGEQ
jgi:hypothetical protein